MGQEAEPVDLKNGLLWIPTEPEDEEDEKEALVFDEDTAGEWGDLHSSNSFGSGEYRCRDRSSEEQHCKAMNNVVDEDFRALIAHLLRVENLPIGEEGDKESWLEIIASLCWEAATLLKPDTSKVGSMDPGVFVKVKCIACGSRSESILVKGVVCRKNVAHKRMTSKFKKPRFLILGGALEYQQEMDHLKMAVAKIDAHQPNVLLVEKSVSHYVQEYLLAKDMSVVLNIKRPLLERIALCTGAQIVPSIDHLSSQKLGYCETSHMEKFLEEHGSAGQGGKKLVKTLMFFEGCPKPLGCTILLKGANRNELKKVKHVVQYCVFAAYNLALETCESDTVPASTTASFASVPAFSSSGQCESDKNQSKLSQNNALEIKREVGAVASATNRGQDVLNDELVTCGFKSLEPSGKGGVTLIDHDTKAGNQTGVSRLLSLHQDGSNYPTELVFPPSPSDHQSFFVSLSTQCVWKGTVCERARLFRIKYYGRFDKPLGHFLRDHLFDQSYRCHSCEMPSEAHVHCYTHGQGRITISVRKLPDLPLPGEQEGKIWMWHRCLQCPRTNGFPPATRRVVMPDAAWGSSFGKFLELSFSNHAAASRVDSCGHSLNRDCLRFYGFGRMIACFHYASIDVNSVHIPPPKLDFNYENQEWIQKEENEVVDTAELLFTELLNALHQISEKRSDTGSIDNNLKAPEPRCHISELEGLLQKEKAQFEKTLNKGPKKCQPVIDILEINRLRRQLLFHSYVWDHRLTYVSSLENDSHQEGLNSSEQKHKEKHSSNIEMLIKINSFPWPDAGFTSTYSLEDTRPDESLNQGGEIGEVANQPGIVQAASDIDQDQKHRKEGLTHVSASSSLANQSDPLESKVVVQRALSEGHFPLVANLLDTLDTAWTGENQAGSVTESLEHASPTKQADTVEDSTSWIGMPFLNFCHSFNESSSGSAPKFDALNEYNPIFVSSFQELRRQGGARLLLPVGINGTVVPVYDDEPTSIIAYALASQDYHLQIFDAREGPKDGEDLHSLHSFVDGLLGKVKYNVTCYHAKRFEALRRTCCPSELDFIRSLSRCKKWGPPSGKSSVFFAKTLDDRFIIKEVTKMELESFIKFAPDYFKYLSESISSGRLTCLAKILGIYQLTSKHLKGGKEFRMNILIMENLLFGQNITRLYDLNGSSQSRYNPDSSGSNKLLLDQNLVEAMSTSPIFVENKAKRLLERAVWNDTAFLGSIDVMEYSLLVGVDEEKHELVIGIINFMKQYTWDKHLETWVKSIFGPKNSSPTVISPKQYKKRFRKAMSTYFLVVPDEWSSPSFTPSGSQTDPFEDNTQDGTSLE